MVRSLDPTALLASLLGLTLIGCSGGDSGETGLPGSPPPSSTGSPWGTGVDAGLPPPAKLDAAAPLLDARSMSPDQGRFPGADSLASPFEGDTAPGSEAGGYTGEGQSWTVLVYMMADNNLEKYGLADLNEMMTVGSNANLHILAQVDRAAGESGAAVGGLPNWTQVKRVRVDPSALTELQNLGDVDMGQAKTLASFVEWGIKTAPADRVALILWDHGGAWPGFGADGSHANSVLTVAEIRQGVADGLKAAGVDRPLDILGFDACLMGTYEIAVGLAPLARYLIASEEIIPGHGWDYKSLVLLRDTPTSKPLALGSALVNSYMEQARQYATDKSVTLSLSDLGGVATLQSAVSALGVALAGDASLAKAIGAVRAKSPTLGVSSTGMIDLGRFISELAAIQPKLASVQAGVSSALAKVVRGKIAGALQTKTTGLSIYFPASRGAYRGSEYAALTGVAEWAAFLSGYYGVGKAIPSSAQPQVVSDQGTITRIDGDLVLVGQLKPGTYANLTSVSVAFGVIVDSNLVAPGNMPGAFDETGAIAGAWDASILRIAQGTTWDYGFYNVSEQESGLLALDIPLAYSEGAGSSERDVWYEIVIDPSATTNPVVSKTYYEQIGDVFGELSPVAGSTLKTKVLVISSSTGDSTLISGTEVFDGTKPLDVSTETLPSGTQIFMVVTAEDFGGATASVYGLAKL